MCMIICVWALTSGAPVSHETSRVERGPGGGLLSGHATMLDGGLVVRSLAPTARTSIARPFRLTGLPRPALKPYLGPRDRALATCTAPGPVARAHMYIIRFAM